MSAPTVPMPKWTYCQSTGVLTNPAGQLVCKGYSGKGEGKNNPAWQAVPELGPLPRGFYKFGEPYFSAKVGPYAIPLLPYPENQMFGRGAFRCHGDSVKDPGNASEGCIIMPRAVREEMIKSKVDILEVVE